MILELAWSRVDNFQICVVITSGPRQANLLLIAYASSEGSGEPAHPRSLARTFAARSYKQWVKRNLQTESQIPGPSEWLGMRSWNMSWRNARRHKFAWRGSILIWTKLKIALHCDCCENWSRVSKAWHGHAFLSKIEKGIENENQIVIFISKKSIIYIWHKFQLDTCMFSTHILLSKFDTGFWSRIGAGFFFPFPDLEWCQFALTWPMHGCTSNLIIYCLRQKSVELKET